MTERKNRQPVSPIDFGAILTVVYARPPLPIAMIRQALAADAPRAFHRRCLSAIGTQARQTARSAGTNDTTTPE
jgi:hypothetical protein